MVSVSCALDAAFVRLLDGCDDVEQRDAIYQAVMNPTGAGTGGGAGRAPGATRAGVVGGIYQEVIPDWFVGEERAAMLANQAATVIPR